MNKLVRFLPDSFMLAILAAVGMALVLPCRGESARWVAIGSDVAIALLFFLQGARLSRSAVLAGILHWRLHLIILGATFVAFPLLGLAMYRCRARCWRRLYTSAWSFSAPCRRPCRRPWSSPRSRAATSRQPCARPRCRASSAW